MPYSSISELPSAVKKLPEAKQKKFLASFNAAHKEYGSEEQAFKVAWSGIKESTNAHDSPSGFRDLVEEFDLAEALSTANFDDANGVIKNVVLLTANKTSANRTHYLSEALDEAKGRYEGANMFIDHGTKGQNRSVRDFGGVYKNVRVEENKLRGDIVLREAARKDMMDIAKMRPSGIGLSIKDRGRGFDKDGVFYVQGFAPEARYSVDFVVDPSVNRDLFESTKITTDEGGDDMDFKVLTQEVLSKERPDLIESIQNAGKAAILKELEEAKAAGGKSDVLAAKLTALVEADFTKDVREAVKQMIMPDGINLDGARAIIKGQKELIEALSKKPAAGKTSSADPKVKGMGQAKEDEVSEGADNLPEDADILEAFGHR